jgi:hypothetical protein
MLPRARRIKGETLRRLLLAVVAVIACVCITGPFRGIVSLRASSAVLHGKSPRTPGSDASPHCTGTGSRPVDLNAIESDFDDDDDDDVLGDVADEPHPPLACLPGGEPGARPCIEGTDDTSRFASSAHPARGPPV